MRTTVAFESRLLNDTEGTRGSPLTVGKDQMKNSASNSLQKLQSYKPIFNITEHRGSLSVSK